MDLENFKTNISFRVNPLQLQKIDEFTKRNRFSSRSNAIAELLRMGMFIEEKIGTVEAWSGEDLQEIKRQFETGRLVEWMEHLTPTKFLTLVEIMRTETQARGMQTRLS